jgi:hypothetical protein
VQFALARRFDALDLTQLVAKSPHRIACLLIPAVDIHVRKHSIERIGQLTDLASVTANVFKNALLERRIGRFAHI